MNNACIYKLINPINDNVYIGSTINLRQRLINHKSDKNNNHMPSRYEKLGDYYCVIVEEIILPDESDRKILKERECYYIKRENPLKLVNKSIPTRTKKQWCQDNRDRCNRLRRENYRLKQDKIKIEKAILELYDNLFE